MGGGGRREGRAGPAPGATWGGPPNPQLLPEATALPGPVLAEDKSPPRGPGAGDAGGGEAAALTRGAEAEAGGDGRVFRELQSDDNQ